MDIHINWDGPLSVSQASELKSSEDYGLYQYYGDHPVYGSGVLLYIGKVTRQPFGARLNQHNWHNWIPSETEIYVGRICSDTQMENSEWESMIDISEKIQIYAHSPAFNTSNLNKIGHHNNDVRVFNWGKRKSLLPEVSIKRWEGGDAVGHQKPITLNHCSAKTDTR
jgi:hypothetical protein